MATKRTKEQKRKAANEALERRIDGGVELFEIVSEHTKISSATEFDLVTKHEIGAAVREMYRVLVGLAQVAVGQEQVEEANARTQTYEWKEICE